MTSEDPSTSPESTTTTQPPQSPDAAASEGNESRQTPAPENGGLSGVEIGFIVVGCVAAVTAAAVVVHKRRGGGSHGWNSVSS